MTKRHRFRIACAVVAMSIASALPTHASGNDICLGGPCLDPGTWIERICDVIRCESPQP